MVSVGSKVKVNGVQGIVINEYADDMYEVRIFMGGRHVGDIVVHEDRLKEME